MRRHNEYFIVTLDDAGDPVSEHRYAGLLVNAGAEARRLMEENNRPAAWICAMLDNTNEDNNVPKGTFRGAVLERLTREVKPSTEATAALREAIQEEHNTEHCESTCHIAAAFRNNLLFYAAVELHNATECPKTDAALTAYLKPLQEAQRREIYERQSGLMLELPFWLCKRCNSTNYTDAEEVTVCGNCSGAKPDPAKELHKHTVTLFTGKDIPQYKVEEALQHLESRFGGMVKASIEQTEVVDAVELELEHLLPSEETA